MHKVEYCGLHDITWHNILCYFALMENVLTGGAQVKKKHLFRVTACCIAACLVYYLQFMKLNSEQPKFRSVIEHE